MTEPVVDTVWGTLFFLFSLESTLTYKQLAVREALANGKVFPVGCSQLLYISNTVRKGRKTRQSGRHHKDPMSRSLPF